MQFPDDEPYQAVQIVVNIRNHLYMVRLWSRTYDKGIVTSVRHLVVLCTKIFDYSVVCKGYARR